SRRGQCRRRSLALQLRERFVLRHASRDVLPQLRGVAAWFLTQRYAGRPRPSNRSAEAAVAPPLDRPLGLVAGEDDMSMSLYASKEEYEQAHAARWYCLDRDGVAMLCKDEADARTQAAESDDCWPG